MNKKLIAFRVDPILDERVKEEAERLKVKPSEMHRRIIYYYFSSMLKKIFK
jgi:hypothetical protein